MLFADCANPIAPKPACEAGYGGRRMERAKGIEPSYEAWEASVLPLNYARVGIV